MLVWPTRIRFAALVLALAAFSGCSSFTPSLPRWMPWSTTAARGPVPKARPVETEPLRPEQKAEIQIAMARGLELQDRTDEAKKIYQEVIQSVPQQPEAYYRLALLYDRKGQCPAAEPYYLQALERAPDNLEVLCDYGYSLYVQERWPEAEANLRHVLTLVPDHERAHNNLGLLLARTQREAEALQEFALAGCEEPEAYANLGFALTLAQRWEPAHGAFQRALALDPNLKNAQAGLASLRSLAAKQRAAQSPPPAVSPPANLLGQY